MNIFKRIKAYFTKTVVRTVPILEEPMTYEDLLCKIVIDNTGEDGLEFLPSRAGPTISIFDEQLVYDLREGLPIVSTKKVYTKAIIGELLWFISGSTDLPSLRRFSDLEKGAKTIWSADYERFAAEVLGLNILDGLPEDLGSVYGAQWRSIEYNGKRVDQLQNLVKGLRENPTSRYHLVSAWNVGAIDNGEEMALPPCHYAFECYVGHEKGVPKYLDLKWHQRSVDTFLGLPFNITSYAILLEILAKLSNLEPRFLTADLGNVHLYEQHLEAVAEQIVREPVKGRVTLRMPEFEELDDLAEFSAGDFTIQGYHPHPPIKGRLSVGAKTEQA